MADVKMTIVKTLEPNVPSEGFSFTEAAANDNVQIEWDGKDTQTTVLVTAAAACELTIKAGDSLQAVNDQVIAVKRTNTWPFPWTPAGSRTCGGTWREKWSWFRPGRSAWRWWKRECERAGRGCAPFPKRRRHELGRIEKRSPGFGLRGKRIA